MCVHGGGGEGGFAFPGNPEAAPTTPPTVEPNLIRHSVSGSSAIPNSGGCFAFIIFFP